MKLTKEHPLFKTFISLSCRLSPENLTCDGECSKSEVAARLRQIQKEWKLAELQFGGKVTEDEVWQAEFQK